MRGLRFLPLWFVMTADKAVKKQRTFHPVPPHVLSWVVMAVVFKLFGENDLKCVWGKEKCCIMTF